MGSFLVPTPKKNDKSTQKIADTNKKQHQQQQKFGYINDSCRGWKNIILERLSVIFLKLLWFNVVVCGFVCPFFFFECFFARENK